MRQDFLILLNSPYAKRPEGVAVAPWRHFLEIPC